MLPFASLLGHSLFYGAILSVLMTALILSTLYLRPMAWVGDAPPDVRAAAGPMSDDDQRFKRVAGVVMLIILVSVFGAALAALARLGGGTIRFLDAAVSTFLIFMVFNLVDLLFIDWLLVVAIRPRFVLIPGAESLAGYGDYGYHFRAFLKGTVGGILLALVVAAIGVVIY